MPSLDSYYQPDFSHRKNKPRTSKPSTAPQYDIGLDGVPIRTSGNPVRPSQADGEPTAYAQHSGTMYYDMSDGRSVYQTPDGTIYDRKGGQQVFVQDKTGETMTYDGAFSATPGSSDAYVGTNGKNIDGQTILEGTQVWKVPDSTSGGASNSGRDDSRTSPTGVAQKGTNMSRSFNDLLATTNTSGYKPYGSSQLPTTEGSPDAGITPKTQAILAGIQAGKQADMSIDGYKGQSYATIQPDDPQFAAAFGQDLADKYQKEGGSKVTGYTKGGRLDQALSDKEGINSYMSKFSSGDRERAANRAFLDTEDSMLALRAKEAVNGVVYANQKHYVAGESADSPAVAIDRSDARDIANGKARAEQFKAKKVADTVAAIKQEPATIEKPDVKQDFGRTETLSAPMNTNIPDNVEFNSNNDNPLPAFNKTGGLKTGFKRIDTSMTNPFG